MNENLIRFEVSDTGFGMNAEDLERVNQAMNAGLTGGINKKSTMTGFGLFISNYVAKNLSKNKELGIRYSSNIGVGS